MGIKQVRKFFGVREEQRELLVFLCIILPKICLSFFISNDKGAKTLGGNVNVPSLLVFSDD